MGEQISPEEYQAIKDFTGDLKVCFLNYQNNHHDAFSDIVLNYVMSILDIHLSLAELKVDRYLCNMEGAQKK